MAAMSSSATGWVFRWPSVRRDARTPAVLGAIAIAFSSILVRLSHASPSTAAIFRCAYALPVLGLLAWREDRRLGPRARRDRGVAIAAGVFFAIDLMLWHHSIGDVGAGLATVLANVQVALVPLVAWAVMSERPGRRVLAGLPLALLGVLLISGVLEHGAYGRDPARGAAFGLGAGVAYVGFLLLLRRGGSDLRRLAGPLFDATATAAVLCVLAGLVIGDARLVPSWPSAGWLITLALSSQVLGWLLIAGSLPRLPAALTSLLLTIQPVGSVALAGVILGESPSGLQLLGVTAVLGGLLVATGPVPAGVIKGRVARHRVYCPPAGHQDSGGSLHTPSRTPSGQGGSLCTPNRAPSDRSKAHYTPARSRSDQGPS